MAEERSFHRRRRWSAKNRQEGSANTQACGGQRTQRIWSLGFPVQLRGSGASSSQSSDPPARINRRRGQIRQNFRSHVHDCIEHTAGYLLNDFHIGPWSMYLHCKRVTGSDQCVRTPLNANTDVRAKPEALVDSKKKSLAGVRDFAEQSFEPHQDFLLGEQMDCGLLSLPQN